MITGSFNFTKAAEENNAENLLVIRDKKLAERYTKNCKSTLSTLRFLSEGAHRSKRM